MTPNPSPLPLPSSPVRGVGDVELLERLSRARADLLAQVGRRIVGQQDVLDGILTAVFSGGHALLLGVPGLAKTLMVQTVAQTLDLKFSRIQFTPDLMPSDITGTEIIEEDQSTGKRSFRFVRGPVFANIVLADEVNRTPPKTQAALLQAMQEHQVTAAGQTHPLPPPCFGPARVAVPDPRRQGARGAGRSAHAGRGRSPRRGPDGAHAPARDQFRGGGGGAERARPGRGAACDEDLAAG